MSTPDPLARQPRTPTGQAAVGVKVGAALIRQIEAEAIAPYREVVEAARVACVRAHVNMERKDLGFDPLPTKLAELGHVLIKLPETAR